MLLWDVEEFEIFEEIFVMFFMDYFNLVFSCCVWLLYFLDCYFELVFLGVV